MIAEIGLEETHELEIEAIRKQVNVCCAGDSLGGWRQNHGALGAGGPQQQ